MLKIKSKWIELQCVKCKLVDRMPLAQFEDYKNYSCPYGEKYGVRCHGKMNVLRIRELEFSPNIQQVMF